MSEFKDQFNEVLRTTLPISIAILVLNTVLVGATPWEFVIEVMCIGLVLIGFTLFLYGVNVDIMPMGKAIGLKIAQRDSILIMVGLVFMIGLVVTIAEPDVTVFTSKVDTIVNELDGTALTISIAVGVSVMMVVAALRMVLKVPLKYVVAVGYALVIILGLIVPEFILGIAFDSGGVTTGPITVPVMMALGVGIGFVASKGGNQMDNFGMIGLASIGPLITVMLYGQLAGMTEVNLIPGSAHVSPVDLSFVGEMLRNSVIDTLISVIPLMLIFIAILKFYVHTSWSDLKVMSVSVVYTAAGMILFLTGVYAGFMPLSEQLGVYLVVNDVNMWILFMGLLLSFLSVVAEPAVKILGDQVEQISRGTLKKPTIIAVVASGVSIFTGVGMYLMSQGLMTTYAILALYGVALILLIFMDDSLVGVAYDAGGVATGPMSVAIIMSMYATIAETIGGDVAVNNAFGAIALIALAPIIALSLFGIVMRIQKKRVQRMASEDAE